MNYRIEESCENVDWTAVRDTLKTVGMGYYEPARHRQAFENSFAVAVVFVFEQDRLIGFGRVISDGAYQAGVYDVAVVPDQQGKGVGKHIMSALLQKVSHCNVILYASPGKEMFYSKLGFSLMKTGMARFRNLATMRTRGFI